VIAALLLIYFGLGDVYLYALIQQSNGVLPLGDPNATIPCYPSPYCHVDMKSLLLDFPNFYIHHPLSATLHEILHFKTTFWFISPNLITFSHVVIALISAKCIAQDSISYRRLGVGLFAVRNFLDAFDGTVARARRPPIDTYHNVGTSGYYIDGVADGIGCIFLFVACFIYMYRHEGRRRSTYYTALNTIDLEKDGHGYESWDSSTNSSGSNSPTSSTPGYRQSRAVWLQPALFGLQSLLCSIAWNRYISQYTKLLEDPSGNIRSSFQSQVVKSNVMWMVIILWRMFNTHAMVEMLLAAIFFDKMAEFFRFVQYIGFIPILGTVCISEMHLNDIEMYLSSVRHD
jgi:hypothetical protein